jgi:curved DNA-binding protein CbpA
MTMTSDASGEAAPRRPGRTPNLTSADPYAVLGLVRGASVHEIRRAYFDLVRTYPPEERPETFKTIRAAYERLRQAEVKAETDLFLFRPPSPWEPRKRKRKLDLEVHNEDIEMLLQQHGDLGQADFRSDYRPVRL